MPDSAYGTLRALPEFHRLVAIARSDNPLVALGTTRREVSWTQFLAWLLDPVRRSDGLGPLFLEGLLSTAHQDIERLLGGGSHVTQANAATLHEIATLEGRTVWEVVSAQAETRVDTKGRIDLLVKCCVGRQRLTVLVENKIEAEESTDQLQSYVENASRNMEAGELLLPMLLTLGDETREKASCPWAVIWNRDHVRRWLELGTEKCRAEGVEVPRLVDDYLEVFEAWDLAKQLRSSRRSLLEQVSLEEPLTDDWELLRDSLAVGDRHFFQEVETALRETLKDHDMQIAVYPEIAGRNAGLQVFRRSWTIHPAGNKDYGVIVHFESRERGILAVHTVLHPYEENIAKRGLTQRFAPQLHLKAQLIKGLRDVLTNYSVESTFFAHTKQLHDPDKPATVRAVKFEPKPGAEGSPVDCARYFTSIISQATPLIDKVVRETKRLRG